MFGILGPNGAGKTTTVEILEGYRRRDAGEVDVLGFDPGRVAARDAGAHRRRAAALRALAGADRARGAPGVRGLLPAATRHRRGDRPRRPGGEARRAREDALGWPEAAARPGHRARRRSRAGVPRRAHDGLRPGGQARGLGDDQVAALAREDRRPDDALPRRGAAARRSRRRAARRRDRADREPGGADGDAAAPRFGFAGMASRR